ncbi:MAG: type II toxin-antitoxin system RelE/ParE family toxin [Pirellulales bacterium]
MSTVLYLPEAVEDLHAIWRYLSRESGRDHVANAMIAEIHAAAARYALEPLLGEQRTDLAPDVRSFRVRRYVAFYVPMATGIEILQVIHGARDIPQWFRQGR